MSLAPNNSGSQRSLAAGFALLVAMGVCCVYLLLRNTGLFLSVPDEWVYSKTARLLAPDAAGVPSHLYFLIYRATNVCGAGYLDCARALNVFFMVGAMPFVYLLCRRVAGRRVALFIALMAVLGPINTYTAYFMPEALYLLMFWVLAWFALRATEVNPLLQGAVMGAIVGLMALVKVHAVFLVPVIVAFLPLRYFVAGSGIAWRKSLLAVLAFLATASLVRFGLGYLFAGPGGLSLFGQIYGSVAPSTAEADRYTRLLLPGLISLKGHALALAALYAVPLAIVFYFPSRRDGGEDAPASREIRLFTFLVFACLLAMTTLFSANAAGSNAMESIARLHMRYYNFALPLLLIVAAGHVSSLTRKSVTRTLPPAVVFGVLAILAVTMLLRGFTPGIVDSPELRGLTMDPRFFSIVATLGLLSLAAWVVNTRLGARLFVFGVLPLVVLVSAYQANRELRQQMRPDVYAMAGISTRQHLGNQSEPIIVFGADHSALYRTMFYLDNPNATSVVIPADSPIPEGGIPAQARWLLIVGDQPLPKGTRKEIAFRGAVLAKVGDQEVQKIDFTSGSWPGLIARTEGLSGPEAWGTWSDGDHVTLEFSRPLPAQFTLVVKAHTIGNSSEPSTIVVGGDRREIRLPAPTELALTFQTDGSARRIDIEIPWARSMKELGVSNDTRRLGIGFVSMSLISKAAPEEEAKCAELATGSATQ
jgi:phosphoglycerol transferase